MKLLEKNKGSVLFDILLVTGYLCDLFMKILKTIFQKCQE